MSCAVRRDVLQSSGVESEASSTRTRSVNVAYGEANTNPRYASESGDEAAAGLAAGLWAADALQIRLASIATSRMVSI